MSKSLTVNQPVLKGCLIGAAIFILLCVIGGMLAWRSVTSLVQEATKEVETELRQGEEKLRYLPAAEIQALSFAELLAAIKANPAAARTQYHEKVLDLSGVVNNVDLAKNIPIKLPADFVSIQATPDNPPKENELILCIYSSAQKTRFMALKVQQPIKVRGKLEIDKDGDLMLEPCVVEP